MLDLTRRAFSVGVACIPALIAPRIDAAPAEIDMEGTLPPLPKDLITFNDAPAYRVYSVDEVVGIAKPTDDEEKTANAILAKAPVSMAPYKIAEFFLAVGRGDLGSEWQPFVREWPVRANPLIMAFFKATNTVPQGDTTPWCAAFVNWCIAQSVRTTQGNQAFVDSELNATSRSASSGSFRCWEPTESPQIGDLVVFAQKGTEKIKCGGQGHVTFYCGKAADGRIRVLGGNQTLKGTSGAVTVGLYPLDGGEAGRLKFLGFRTAAALRKT